MNNLEFYKDTLKTFNKHKIKYLIVGGFAVNSYGFMRSTADLDLWIATDKSNLNKLSEALVALNYQNKAIKTGISELTENRNINLKHGNFFKIKLISFLSGILTFHEAYKRKTTKNILGLKVSVIGFDDLCNIKIKSGRRKDLLDVKELKRIRNRN